MKLITLYLAAIISVITTTSCSNDITEEQATSKSASLVPMTFTATQEKPEITRTAISGDGTTKSVIWSSDTNNKDIIAVWDGTQINSFTATPESQNSTSATLSGSVTSGSTSFAAVYPYSMGKNCTFSSDNITGVVIPNTQTATSGTYDPVAAVMTAATTTNSLSFLNACSFLKITTTKAYLGIVVSVTSGSIAGTFSCSNYDSNPTLTATSGNSSITLMPSSGSTIAAGTYYIAVAAGKISGLTVDCYTTGNQCEEKKGSSSVTLNLERSKSYDLGNTTGWSSVTPNLLLGAYSVSDTKKVLFTKGNLWCATTKSSSSATFALESTQTDYTATIGTNGAACTHLDFFSWQSIEDLNSGTDARLPYKFNKAKNSLGSDTFWCGVDNPLTINGTSGLYVLTSDEWSYLLHNRKNAENLYKYGVTVGSLEKCMIIAPDEYDYVTSPLKASYTSLDEINSLGLVCLPFTGSTLVSNKLQQYGYVWTYSGDYTGYWTATKKTYIDLEEAEIYEDSTPCGNSIRLVKTYSE